MSKQSLPPRGRAGLLARHCGVQRRVHRVPLLQVLCLALSLSLPLAICVPLYESAAGWVAETSFVCFWTGCMSWVAVSVAVFGF